jgi:hypothetical protein
MALLPEFGRRHKLTIKAIAGLPYEVLETLASYWEVLGSDLALGRL